MSRQETAPGVISEAMASGTAVVANAICGIPFMVVDKETGLLAAPENINEFGHKLAELARDPSRCRRYGERGREIARTEYDPRKVAEATINVYHNLLSLANPEAAKCSSS
jgi:glycosyltransferase involved in cell wall biosynthesis